MRLLYYILLLSLVQLGVVRSSFARNDLPNFLKNSAFVEIGEEKIAFPKINNELVLVPKEHYDFVRTFVPESNRLLLAYVSSKDLKLLTDRTKYGLIRRYAIVQIPKNGEHKNISKNDFIRFKEYIEKDYNMLKINPKQLKAQTGQILKELEMPESEFLSESPIFLGKLFSKDNSFGYAQLNTYIIGESKIKLIGAAIFIRVKKKLIFAYLYFNYENINTLDELEETAENWATRIIDTNRRYFKIKNKSHKNRSW